MYSITLSPSVSQSSTQSVTYSSTHYSTFTPSLSSMLSPSLTPSSMEKQTLASTFSPYPTTTPTQVSRVSPLPSCSSTILTNVSDNAFYAIVSAVIILFLLNIVTSIHYYTEYTNEKTRRRLVDPVQLNPYHTSARDTFNRV